MHVPPFNISALMLLIYATLTVQTTIMRKRGVFTMANDWLQERMIKMAENNKNNRTYYFQYHKNFNPVPNKLRVCKGLSSEALLILLELAWKMNDKDYCFPSLETIEEITGIPEKTIRRKLKELEDKFFITKENRKGQSTKYHLNRLENNPYIIMSEILFRIENSIIVGEESVGWKKIKNKIIRDFVKTDIYRKLAIRLYNNDISGYIDNDNYKGSYLEVVIQPYVIIIDELIEVFIGYFKENFPYSFTWENGNEIVVGTRTYIIK